MLVAFNVIVLGFLVILLIAEEVRYRRFSERVEETRNVLLSIVRQMRTPLSAQRKHADMLQTKELGSLSIAQHEALARMEASREDLMLLLNRLLSASKLEEGEIALKPVRVSLLSVLSGVIDSLSSHIEERDLRVDVKGAGRAVVRADPLLLHGIFDEILQNAVVYTPTGGSVEVRALVKARSVEVSVRDTGIGIDASERPHVFEKFFRGERARKLHSGNGLGLFFVRQFLASLRGQISFSSQAGKGSTFTIELPRAS